MASILIRIGDSSTFICGILSHSTKFTLDTYGHWDKGGAEWLNAWNKPCLKKSDQVFQKR
jgi:hypothetical protein